MRVALVAPPTRVADRYPTDHPLRRGVQVTEPLGLGYLASMIEDIADVEIIDAIAENLSTRDCVERVGNRDIVGISAVTSNMRTALNLAKEIKVEHPYTTIVFGGIHPSLRPYETLYHPAVDLVVIGEGEYTFRRIVDGQPYPEIAGIGYRANGAKRVNPPDPLETNLDRFPFPARHLLKMERYRPFLYLRSPIHSLISSRGCPFTCTYCCRDISGQRYRVRTPECVVEEVKELVHTWHSREVAFQDPVFGLTKKWVHQFCRLLIAEKLDVVWSALTRVDLINRETLRMMKKSGAWMVYFGIEAGNQTLLDIMKKRTTLAMIEDAMNLVSQAGIKTWGSFMFALPGEDPQRARETLDFALRLPLDFASFHLTTPFLGTELYEDVDAWGMLTINEDEYTQLNPVFIPYGWHGKEAELKQFFADAFKRFYLRPLYILHQLRTMRSLDELAMYFRGLKVI